MYKSDTHPIRFRSVTDVLKFENLLMQTTEFYNLAALFSTLDILRRPPRSGHICTMGGLQLPRSSDSMWYRQDQRFVWDVDCKNHELRLVEPNWVSGERRPIVV